jgi:hypothetical protein
VLLMVRAVLLMVDMALPSGLSAGGTSAMRTRAKARRDSNSARPPRVCCQ